MLRHSKPGLRAKGDSFALTVASVVNGLAAYAIIVITSRFFGDRDFASFSVAWSVWAVSVALLVFPLQHWIIWRATSDGGVTAVRAAMPRILAISGVVIAGLYLSGASARLFPTGDAWPWILAAIGATSAALGLGRGLLAAHGLYERVAWVIGLENLIRLGVIAVVLNQGLGPQAAVLGVAAGVLAMAPFARSLELGRAVSEGPVKVVVELAALAGATAVAQVLVQFPPAMAEWLGDPPERVAALFATFSLGRAPLLIMLALTTRLTEPLTRLLAPTETAKDWVSRAIVAIPAAGLTAGAVGYMIGPAVVAWLFGPGRALSRFETAAISTGLVLAMAGLVAILALMALRANGRAAGYWIAAFGLAVAMSFLGSGIPLAFLSGEILALGLSSVTLWRRLRQPLPA